MLPIRRILRSSLRAACVAVIASAALCTSLRTGHASDVAPALANLGSALTARVNVIGENPATKELSKERSRLLKAQKSFVKLSGVVDATALPTFAAGLRSLVKAETADLDVLAGATDLVSDLAACIGEQEPALRQRLAEIYTLADAEKANSLLNDALDAIREAAAIADQDILGALQRIETAATTFGKAGKFIEKTIARLEAGAQPRLGFPLSVRNLNGKAFTIQSITFDVNVTPPGGDLGSQVRVTATFKEYQDAVSGFVLPYKMVDETSEFDVYPTLLAAIAGEGGSTLQNARIVGSMRFVSTKHGTVDVPLDLFVE
jgi:hypothetical protein